jgi:peptide/nickel transport system permease protein
LPKYLPIKEKIYPIRLFYRGDEYKLFGLFRLNLHLFGVDKPAKIHIFGSDWNGRDIFSRLLYAGRISLSIGILAVLLSFAIGMIIGGIAGYFGGLIDNLLMRIVEVIMSFPGFYLLLALRAVFPLGLSSSTVYILIVLIMSFIGWASLARVIRGIVLSIKEREYILAAKALGKHPLKIILSDILPNTCSYAIVAATLSIPMYILSESALSLLGLGITEPQASWGNMLTKAMNISDMTQHPWILIPGFFIFLAVMGYNLLGDGLRDAFDPKAFI